MFFMKIEIECIYIANYVNGEFSNSIFSKNNFYMKKNFIFFLSLHIFMNYLLLITYISLINSQFHLNLKIFWTLLRNEISTKKILFYIFELFFHIEFIHLINLNFYFNLFTIFYSDLFYYYYPNKIVFIFKIVKHLL